MGSLPYTTLQMDIEYIFQQLGIEVRRSLRCSACFPSFSRSCFLTTFSPTIMLNQVKHVRMVRDRETEKFKGTAFVELNTREELIKGLTLDGTVSFSSFPFRSCVPPVFLLNPVASLASPLPSCLWLIGHFFFFFAFSSCWKTGNCCV